MTRIVKQDGNRLEFDCGCVSDVSGSRLVLIPCSLSCPVYAFHLEESNKMNHPIHFYKAKPTSKEQAEA